MLAVLASPVCPLQEDVLRQALLGRIMSFIRAQYRVREPEPYSCHPTWLWSACYTELEGSSLFSATLCPATCQNHFTPG